MEEPDSAELVERSSRALDLTLARNPQWRIANGVEDGVADIRNAAELTVYATFDGECALVTTPETFFVTEVVKYMYGKPLVIRTPAEWSGYEQQKIVIWDGFEANPDMLAVADLLELTGKGNLPREFNIRLVGVPPVAVRLLPETRVILVSEQNIGNIISQYDTVMLNRDLETLVENVNRIDILRAVLMTEEEQVPVEEASDV